MSDELHQIWRDDRLIEAAARGDLHHTADARDAAAGPLCALAQVADARPLPRLDVAPEELVVTRGHHRYAVRSLAVAVAAVATLSTSGVSAVVTGDPFRPAKAFWQEIQDHTVARSEAVDPDVHSGSAVGSAEREPVLRAPETGRDVASPTPDGSGGDGQTAHAPSQAPLEEPSVAPTPTADDASAGEAEEPAATSEPRASADDEAATTQESRTAEESPREESTQEEPEQESTQEPDDEESPDTEQESPSDEESGDDEIDPLEPLRSPSDDSAPRSSQREWAEEDTRQPLPSEPVTSPTPEPTPAPTDDATAPLDELTDGASAADEQGEAPR